jgi:hypothetical protein
MIHTIACVAAGLIVVAGITLLAINIPVIGTCLLMVGLILGPIAYADRKCRRQLG